LITILPERVAGDLAAVVIAGLGGVRSVSGRGGTGISVVRRPAAPHDLAVTRPSITLPAMMLEWSTDGRIHALH
jgi:hypothetical protein